MKVNLPIMDPERTAPADGASSTPLGREELAQLASQFQSLVQQSQL